MEFTPTGITRKDYLDVIELVVDAYGTDLLESQLELPDNIYHFTAFRTSVMLAYLIESGRRPELLDLWTRVTEKSVRALENSRNSNYNDLTLEELCISFLLMKEHVRPDWLEVLRNTKPETHYSYLTKDVMNNMVVYGCVGMYLREKLTGESCEEHFDKVMPWVMEYIDENGMFDDNDHALLYDLTTRVRLEQLLWFGYDGKWETQIGEALTKAGEMTLKMQSAAFQIPYGGRSNQFLHNEALQTSLCEYEAVRCKARGDMEKAEIYKRAGHLSFRTLSRYLDLPGGAKHIRNLFPQDCVYGIDHYGTFPRYMNALATFIACGYLAADDTIGERSCPAELGGYAISTAPGLGKVFGAVKGQSIEYAILADPHHEAPGLGRYHAAGVPAELGLTMPFTATPSYMLSQTRIPFDVIGPNPVINEFAELLTDHVPSRMLAISPGYVGADGKETLMCENQTPRNVEILEQSEYQVCLRATWDGMVETIVLNENGLQLTCESSLGNALWAVPLLADNGAEQTAILCDENTVQVRLGKAAYLMWTDDQLQLTHERIGNRNGIYRIAYARSDSPSCTVHLKLTTQ